MLHRGKDRKTIVVINPVYCRIYTAAILQDRRMFAISYLYFRNRLQKKKLEKQKEAYIFRKQKVIILK